MLQISERLIGRTFQQCFSWLKIQTFRPSPKVYTLSKEKASSLTNFYAGYFFNQRLFFTDEYSYRHFFRNENI